MPKTKPRTRPAQVSSGIRRRLENLRPCKPGEIRNPTGTSGATKRRASFNAIGLDVMGRPIELRSATGGKMIIPGDEAVWLAMRNRAVKGDVSAAVWVRDTLYGKPMERMRIEGEGQGPQPLIFVVERGGVDGRASLGREMAALPGPDGSGHDRPKMLEAEQAQESETTEDRSE